MGHLLPASHNRRNPQTSMRQVFIALGSNLGQPEQQLVSAVQALATLCCDDGLRWSRLYCSEPVGPPGQPDYLNAVVALGVTLAPLALLNRLQAIEAAYGRERKVRWGPRTLDLDILIYGDEIIFSQRLHVPHPRIAERLFVLRPLMDIDPLLRIPGVGAVSKLLAECPPLRLDPVPWPLGVAQLAVARTAVSGSIC